MRRCVLDSLRTWPQHNLLPGRRAVASFEQTRIEQFDAAFATNVAAECCKIQRLARVRSHTAADAGRGFNGLCRALLMARFTALADSTCILVGRPTSLITANVNTLLQ